MARLFPAFLKLEGRGGVVVGAGPVAAQKLAALREAGAEIVVVAPEIRPEIEASGAELRRRAFVAEDLDGAWFVVAAAPPEVNAEVAKAAAERRIFVNAVDDPSRASAYLGGVVRKAGVTVALSTEGFAPALAGLLREAVESLLPDDLEKWGETAKTLRAAWKAAAVPMQERRPLLLEALNRLYAARAEDR